MDEQPAPPAIDYSAAYYDPPRVKWWVLLIGSAIASILLQLFTPKVLADFLSGLIYGGWALFVCIWIRRIDPNAKSIFWILGGIVTSLMESAIPTPFEPSLLLVWAEFSLAFLSAVCFIVCTFVVRSELERHYNEREDFGLRLGPFMTFFFGFLYFQFHLFDIAEQREKERTSFTNV
jgi:hypothetical protein